MIKPMEGRHASRVAELHRKGIDTGFLSSLGGGFLTALYRTIPSCPAGFGYVWQHEEEVLGFICCADNIGKVYRQCLLRGGLLMAPPILRFLINPSVIRRMFQTLRYPSQIGDELPGAEVLSIVVSSDVHGKGVGKALMQAAINEFRKRGHTRLKVAVSANNEVAIRFYERCGFTLAAQRKHHDLPMNVYIIELAE